ncbi:hypothetical protein [Streptomyces avermitilis]|uniref:hypothetical protein n=1 Tax=Streptomyces avermitilis TaxID=33903 RepID=UPI0033F25B4E
MLLEGCGWGRSCCRWATACRRLPRTVTGLADRLPAQTSSPDLPEHPDCPRILAVFNEATSLLRARDVCEALNHELLPKNIEGIRAKLKRLVKLDVLTEVDAGSFTRKQ